MKKIKISMVTPLFPPEIGGASHLAYELAKSLIAYGHEILVLTAYPQYNIRNPPKKYQRGNMMRECIDGIDVCRLRIPNFRTKSKIAKGMQHIIYSLLLCVLSFISTRTDVILTYSPPLPLPWLLCWASKFRNVPVVVSIQDLFPLEAVELGMMSNPLLIRMFELMEKQMYRQAEMLTVHSPGNINHIIANGGRPDQAEVIYNWVDINRIVPQAKDNDFAKRNGLLNRFVVSYAGTMGWAQDMKTIVESAVLLKNDPNIVFLLVGDGVEKAKAQKKCRQHNLNNIIWMPMQPWYLYPEILAASNISMINLHPTLRTPVVPSKLISIMAAGRPVIASLPNESDARKIIKDANCGLCVEAGNVEALVEAIRLLEKDQLLAERMGINGRGYAETHFSIGVCTRKMESVLSKVIANANVKNRRYQGFKDTLLSEN